MHGVPRGRLWRGIPFRSPDTNRDWCAGEIVSQASLTEMTTMHDGYGLGIGEWEPAGTVGHFGSDSGGVSLAGCLPESGVVFLVLANRGGDFVGSTAHVPLIRAVSAP